MVIQRVSSATPSRGVLYIGSAVPLETSEGLEAVQQPLKARYPVDKDDSIQGIPSILTILPEGIQLRYESDPSHVVLFPYSGLTMCAAVRCVKTSNPSTGESTARFVSLNSPEASAGANSMRPAIFTAITRRSKGRQVLECHGFITNSPQDAIDLVSWTSANDRRCKMGMGGAGTISGPSGTYSTLGGGGAGGAVMQSSSSYYDLTPRGEASFRGAETNSLPEFPVQLVPGEPTLPNASPAFYKEPPTNGYFYATKNTQVKKYSLQKFRGNAGMENGPSVVPGFSGPVHPTMFPPQPTPTFVHPPPPQPGMVPVRPINPQAGFVRPVMFGGPGGPPPPPPVFMPPRPRFFSPPPAPVAVRAVPMRMPVFVGPPPGAVPSGYYENGVQMRSRRGRRGSKGSSHSRSSSGSSASSSPDSPRLNGGQRSPMKARDRDGSSSSSSRPRTPPTDYDVPRGSRMSRRDDFFMRQGYARGPPPHGSPPMGRRGPLGPPGFYMVPNYGYYGSPVRPPPGYMQRPRSVPPPGERGLSPSRRDKKHKKGGKKSGRKGGKKGHRNPMDESSESVGYMSELGPAGDNRQPRDFRRMENQFKHERAFSKSLANEQRFSTRGDANPNPYSLNLPEGNTHDDFPMY